MPMPIDCLASPPAVRTRSPWIRRRSSMLPVSLDGAACYQPSRFIEEWIEHLENSNCDLYFDSYLEQAAPAISISIMSRTPSPQKRKATHPDPDATPTGPAFTKSTIDTASESSDVVSFSSSRSGASSPKKREAELRADLRYPLHRQHISSLQQPTALMTDLMDLEDGPVIPSSVRELMTRDSTWSNRPKAAWFHSQVAPPRADAQSPSHASLDGDTYTYMRLAEIRENTILCKTRMEHEAGWNGAVHAPLLQVALRSEPEISHRNVSSTTCRILPAFRESNPFLTDVKIDYAFFLEPAPENPLAAALQAYRQPNPHARHVALVQLPDNPNTPAAIPVETKSASADAVLGPVQLATWARAHFRHLESLPSAADLPLLPVIFVHGATWRVDFAQRTHDKLIMWEGFLMGSSDEMYGCYKIVAHLRRLARWSREEYGAWLLGALQPDLEGSDTLTA
ncbi:Putative PD-(D/E)XK nuclease [Colletotrichum destructivum]|uniref:PD-(D/E)XK nuclease n=1 Tax=Colletotrichum destructivum TaxID=34406 RepID=A0AAX4J598_9PEZI|nr:Putative PD-(D/E)XK nuclease [Colletotrichum destructivum]